VFSNSSELSPAQLRQPPLCPVGWAGVFWLDPGLAELARHASDHTWFLRAPTLPRIPSPTAG
jgi:hypothetical protein